MTQTKTLIFNELQELPDQHLEQILLYIQQYKKELQQDQAQDKPIWEVADDLIQTVPEQLWQHSRKDGAENHDHYLYSQTQKE